MRTRDILIIIVTLLILLIGSQAFHIIRYNSLQNRIDSEFSELAYDFSSALDSIQPITANIAISPDALAIAHTLGELIDYIDAKTALSTAETSEIRMFIWSLYPYLNSALNAETIDQDQLAELSAIFHDYYNDPDKKDIMSALYRHMHSTNAHSAAVNAILRYS